jgi:hypothetical protein
MTTTTRTRNNDALCAYVAAQVAIAATLARIATALEAHQDAQPPEAIHWGHVGDLSHVQERLAEIESFINGNG